MKMNNKKYIYNLDQAYFYIQNGVRPIETPQKHFTTNKIFFVFDFNATQKVYEKWCNQKH